MLQAKDATYLVTGGMQDTKQLLAAAWHLLVFVQALMEKDGGPRTWKTRLLQLYPEQPVQTSPMLSSTCTSSLPQRDLLGKMQAQLCAISPGPQVA